MTDAGWAPELDGRLPAARWLCHQTQELVGWSSANMPNIQWPEHHLHGATDSDMATTELVLETAIDALTRRTLVVANLLGPRWSGPQIFQATGFGSQYGSARALSPRGLTSINADVAE